jgi:hypothetical protein
MLIVAGPIDFSWHSAFGLDGLLSPPHLVLLLGMILSSVGAMLGIISYINSTKILDDKKAIHMKSLNSYIFLLIVIGILPVWMTLDGLIGMSSLPFSKTQYFNFDPDPTAAAILATISYPLLVSFVLCSSFHIGGEKFGILSLIGASYLAIHAITTIIPNESLILTLPFYILNIIPIIISDISLSFSPNNLLYSVCIPGAILGSSFFMMQYPLVTYVYTELSSNQAFVWPSQISSTYFGMIDSIYLLILGPAFSMGIVGAVLAHKIKISNWDRYYKKMQNLRSSMS